MCIYVCVCICILLNHFAMHPKHCKSTVFQFKKYFKTSKISLSSPLTLWSYLSHRIMGFPCHPAGKESTCNAGDPSSIPGLGRSPGKGKGSPLQYSGLENSMDCIVHGAAKSRTRLSDLHFRSQSPAFFPPHLTQRNVCSWSHLLQPCFAHLIGSPLGPEVLSSRPHFV